MAASTYLTDYLNTGGASRDPASVAQAAKVNQSYDYNDIMKGYDSILNNGSRSTSSKSGYVPISPTITKYMPTAYSRSSDLDSAISGLNSFASSGGYSSQDVSDIRERGLSPLRSVYSLAKDDVRRKNVLAGGTASNYGAVTAKMARELGYQLSDKSTKINADIADMLAKNKFNALTALTPIVSHENDLKNQIDQNNAQGERDYETRNNSLIQATNEFNRESENDVVNNQLKALSGKTQLYGTTPQLSQTFANQVLQNQQLNNTANMIKTQRTPGFAGVTLPGSMRG
jgi:hypothetical protein